MPKLPVISGKNLLRLLIKNNFILVRQKGSHVFVTDVGGKKTTIIPVHANEDLGKGLLKSILADLEISMEELILMISK